MRECRADHARHGRDGLEYVRAVAIPFGEERVGAKAQYLRKAKGNAIRNACYLVMDAKVDVGGVHG